jgi:hypothetical protein
MPPMAPIKITSMGICTPQRQGNAVGKGHGQGRFDGFFRCCGEGHGRKVSLLSVKRLFLAASAATRGLALRPCR